MFYYQLLHKFRSHSITLLPSCVSPHCLNCVYYFVVFLGYVIPLIVYALQLMLSRRTSHDLVPIAIHSVVIAQYFCPSYGFPQNPNRNVWSSIGDVIAIKVVLKHLFVRVLGFPLLICSCQIN
jgi:hypothetical protein